MSENYIIFSSVQKYPILHEFSKGLLDLKSRIFIFQNRTLSITVIGSNWKRTILNWKRTNFKKNIQTTLINNFCMIRFLNIKKSHYISE